MQGRAKTGDEGDEGEPISCMIVNGLDYVCTRYDIAKNACYPRTYAYAVDVGMYMTVTAKVCSRGYRSRLRSEL